MRKTWVIACREFRAMVGTKAFLVSITLMPLLMFGGGIAGALLQKQSEQKTKRIAVVDAAGGPLFDALQTAADALHKRSAADDQSPSAAPRYVLERLPDQLLDDARRLALSDRVRRNELDGFVEIPADALSATPRPDARPIEFYAQNAMLSDESRWVQGVLNAAASQRRMAELGLDPEVVAQATSPLPYHTRGLFKATPDGAAKPPEQGPNIASIFLPFGLMLLMFMVLMLSAQPMMEGVMEEKTGRVAEVLLGSVSSFQLMLGKLLGNIAGSLTMVAIYAGGALALAAYYDRLDMVPWQAAPWFLLYQVLAVLLYGSIFLSVGAAVTQLKEAQSLLLPVWLLSCLPMFVWIQLVREPNGSLATGMSFFPPAAPMTMVLRLASDATIPAWQIAVSVALMVAAALVGVFVAGRIFRTGLLWHGQTPKLAQLLKWGLRG